VTLSSTNRQFTPARQRKTAFRCSERESGLKNGIDFHVGYSPERINPGDAQRRFETITKVVSGQDAETLDTVAQVYGAVVTAGVHRAPSIKVAEAAKVIENTQRDLNIALINELALIFNLLGIDTSDVLAAAGTKWNFLKFTPGLVGGIVSAWTVLPHPSRRARRVSPARSFWLAGASTIKWVPG